MSNTITQVKSLIQRTDIVPYLTPDEVYRIVDVAKEGNKGERNSLLIKTLFETGLRISEALSITPRMIGDHEGHAVLYIKGKGKKFEKANKKASASNVTTVRIISSSKKVCAASVSSARFSI